MDCQSAQDWLLDAERPGDSTAAPEVAGHLRSCAACATLQARLVKLEERWRAMPIPETANSSRDAFLLGLRPRPARRWFAKKWAPRAAIAALALFAIGLGSLFLFPGLPPQASSDVVDRLVSWNVDLADESARPKAVEQFVAAEPQLLADVARLTDSDRDLAERLLANSRWLASNDDPIETADRMQDVADQLLEGIGQAGQRGDARRLQLFARNYERFANQSVDATLRRASALATLTPEQRKRLDRIERRIAERQQALAQLQEKTPDASKKTIRRLYEALKKRPKSKTPAGPKGNSA